jgi:hypothetical protein
MSQSAKTAIGGMVTALSVVVLMPTALDLFVYALPALAGMLTMFSVVELDKKWSFGVYVAVSFISLLLVPNKEAAILYVAFFGYYPILKAVLESKLPKVPEYIIKFFVFNVSVIVAYAVLIKILGMPFDELMGLGENEGLFTKYAVPVMLILGNIVFITYDIALTRIVTAYLRVWQKKFKKLFPFK